MATMPTPTPLEQGMHIPRTTQRSGRKAPRRLKLHRMQPVVRHATLTPPTTLPARMIRMAVCQGINSHRPQAMMEGDEAEEEQTPMM